MLSIESRPVRRPLGWSFFGATKKISKSPRAIITADALLPSLADEAGTVCVTSTLFDTYYTLLDYYSMCGIIGILLADENANVSTTRGLVD